MEDVKLNLDSLAYDWCVYRHKTFSVVIHSWKSKNYEYELYSRGGEYKFHWNVYANIFEDHPYYDNIELIESLPFHGGITYDQHITHEGKLNIGFPLRAPQTTLKVGSDYGHYCDDWYAEQDPKDGVPSCIQQDALDLVYRLLNAVVTPDDHE